jgi:hypothetical protein
MAKTFSDGDGGAHSDAEIAKLRAALEQTRQFIVIACGDQAPYVKAALAVIDAALQPSP